MFGRLSKSSLGRVTVLFFLLEMIRTSAIKCKQRVESLPGLLEKAENEKAELLNYIRRHAAVPGPGRKRPDGSPAETEHISLKLGASTPPSTKGIRQIRDNEDFKVAVCSAILILFLFSCFYSLSIFSSVVQMFISFHLDR